MTANPREQYLKQHAKREWATLSKEAIDDLKFFGKRAEQGKRLGWDALRNWMRDKHGVNPARTRMATLARENGVDPWWSV